MDAHPTDRENPLEKDFRQIIERGDAAALRELIDRHPETHAMLDQPWFAFGAPAIVLAASRADRELIRALLDAGPDLDRLLADAAWMGRTEAVRTMLELGFDPAVPGDHDSTPLDRASFHGLVAIVALLLEHDPEPPLERKNAFGGTPLDALAYGSVHGWRTDGDYPAAARLLLEAGARTWPAMVQSARPDVAAVLRDYLD